MLAWLPTPVLRIKGSRLIQPQVQMLIGLKACGTLWV